jgi:hypothetical protein
MSLPRAGTLVSVTENLGRTLLLVEFENGQHEYLFDHEVEFPEWQWTESEVWYRL